MIYIMFLSRAADGCVLKIFFVSLPPATPLVAADLGNPEYAKEKTENLQQCVYIYIATDICRSVSSHCKNNNVYYYYYNYLRYVLTVSSNVAYYYCQ